MDQSTILNILEKLGSLDIVKSEFDKGDKEKALELLMTKLLVAEDAFPKIYNRVKDNLMDYEEKFSEEFYSPKVS